MKFSPKAHRFVALAIRDLPDAAAKGAAWQQHPAGADLSVEMLALATEALAHGARAMRQRLDAADDDDKAELINDLRFIAAIQQSLKDETPARKYG